MNTLLFTLCSLLFFILAWKNFRLAVGLFIISLPSYLIRFTIPAPSFFTTHHIPGLPTTLLEINFALLFIVWLIKYSRVDLSSVIYRLSQHKIFLISLFLFFLASTVSIFVSDMWWYSLGQWRAYFLEPMLLFLVILGRTGTSSRGTVSTSDLVAFLFIASLPVSIFGIIQHFTGWYIGNADTASLAAGRITSLFLSPNSAALYLVPPTLLGFAAYHSFPAAQPQKRKWWVVLVQTTILFNLVAILLTHSYGGWLALFGGCVLVALLQGYKKTAVWLVGCALVLTAIMLTGHGLSTTKQQSASNRLTLWRYTAAFLVRSPQNFIFGTGVGEFFRKVQKPYYNVKELERLIYPHNIFLNFWTETGLLGLISFLAIFYSLSHIAYLTYRQGNRTLSSTLLAVLVAILLHGLIDVPYFKNDLAMMFWMIAATIFSLKSEASTSLETSE